MSENTITRKRWEQPVPTTGGTYTHWIAHA